ncbi:hypothetical protein ABGB17_11235 [Sphaerisporangium sp. B11E5]|uniref:hypothetical protein n=1 Tax=Sphaerisporangium sp. B11E5 TaxID=3153563 RepID=UPI00325D4B0E
MDITDHPLRHPAPGDWGNTPQQPPPRPGTVMVAMVSTVIAVLAALATAVLALTAGKEMLLSYATDEFGLDGGSGRALAEYAANLTLSTLRAQAVVWIVSALIIALLLLPLRKARTWARVILTLFIPGMILLGLRDMAGAVSPVMGWLGALIALAMAVALVAWWLPPGNRYARYHKGAGRGQRRA